MAKIRVVVYGLSTEGYRVASQMAIKGAAVHIIDESTPSAIPLTPEIAKTYPNVTALKEDEPLLSMEPIDEAISKAHYLFFTPRILKGGQDIKIEITSKFKTAIAPLKKNSGVVNTLPSGFGGNNENVSLLEYVTGLETGRTVSYFYYPLGTTLYEPKVIGSYNKKEDARLAGLLSTDSEKKFLGIQASEQFHAINTLQNFSGLCSMLEVCKSIHDEQTRADMAEVDLRDIFLDDMMTGYFDLKSLSTSYEGTNPLIPMINSNIKGLDGYIKKLIDVIRLTLKRHDIKASRTKVALSWTFDQFEMRSDKHEMLKGLIARLRDYIGDVQPLEEDFDMYHSDKAIIVVVCSKLDYENMLQTKHEHLIIVKANPLCEIIK